jgi:ribonuclease BN (tRNA processing enzyme)
MGMKIIFLGTNGWYDTQTGNTVCVLIETLTEYLILDAGQGFYKIDQYVTSPKPIYLFLSHFHLDHICGLHVLNKFEFPQGIDIFGPKGLKKDLKFLINKPFTAPLRDLKTKIRLNELGSKAHIPAHIPFSVQFKRLNHTTFCYGYRFLLENKTVAYCTDTGICKNLYVLADKADLLISECSFPSGLINEKWPHLNPEQAAGLAKEAQVKKMALIHFDASLYPTLKYREEDQRQARKIFSRSYAMRDNQEIDLI